MGEKSGLNFVISYESWGAQVEHELIPNGKEIELND